MFASGPRREFDYPGISQRLSRQVAQQLAGCLVVGPELAAKHHAITNPVLERNTPLPTGLVCYRSGIRYRGPTLSV